MSYRAVMPWCWLGLLLAMAGCAPDRAANKFLDGCETTAECQEQHPSLICRHGFCVLPPDAGTGACLAPERPVANGDRIECYTGPEDVAGVGACKYGERECVDGTLTSCLGQVMPDVETCNGQDDDCDGETDELSQTACDTGMMGACAEGELVCRGTRAACDPVIDPQPETCNGTDDDCDGQVDEDLKDTCYPDATAGCVENADGSFTCMGLCTPGSAACLGDESGPCTGMITPSPEEGGVAGRDDDCDGDVDEGVCEEGLTCYGGPEGTMNVGRCSEGTLSCPDGTCTGQIVPRSETCANMAPQTSPDDPAYDDDCNGVVDDVPLLGEPCVDDNEKGECRRGTYLCSGDVLTCVTNEPRDEICDDKDNDCDGEFDEDFDLLTDEANCGTCGNTCGQGLTCCQGMCMDLLSSQDACGSCGNPCGEGLTCCTGECADLSTSNLHCGSCGDPCGDGQSCCGSTCYDVRTNPTHCGSCGNSCDDGQECCDGTCADACTGCDVTCPNGTTCCGSSCVDRQTDESNCGTCGNSCDAGEVCCGGSCVANDTTTHCGSCTNSCSTGQLCCGGMCVSSTDEANCGSCGNECGGGELCCGETCVGGNTDANCGSCGNECGGGESCSNGKCCLTSQTNCDGTCVDVRTNASHCGSCGNECLNGERCSNGCCCQGNQGCRC